MHMLGAQLTAEASRTCVSYLCSGVCGSNPPYPQPLHHLGKATSPKSSMSLPGDYQHSPRDSSKRFWIEFFFFIVFLLSFSETPLITVTGESEAVYFELKLKTFSSHSGFRKLYSQVSLNITFLPGPCRNRHPGT